MQNLKAIVIIGAFCIAAAGTLYLLVSNMNDMKAQIKELKTKTQVMDKKATELENILRSYEKELGLQREDLESFKRSTWQSLAYVRKNFISLRFGKDHIKDIKDGNDWGMGGSHNKEGRR